MPRDITVKFSDGSTHVYRNAPDNLTPDQAAARAQRDFPGLQISHLDGGRGGAKAEPSFSQAFFGKMGRDLVGMMNPALTPIVGPTIDRVLGANTVRDFTQRAVQPITFNAADEVVSAVPAVAAARRGQPVKQAFSQSQRQQSQERQRIQRERPTLAAAADLTGGLASMAIPAPAIGAASNTLKGAMGAGATLGGAQGFLSGFLGADEGERLPGGLAGGLTGAAIGGVAPYALESVGNAIARARQPAGLKPIDPNVRLLAEEGVALTPGQMRGGVARSAEEAATSVPFLGQKITQRRREGIETFNRAVANRVLKPVGETLPDNVKPGSEAVTYAGNLIQKGYEDTIPERAIRLDPAFSEDVSSAFDATIGMTPAGRDQLDDIIFQRVTSRVPENGIIDGRRYKLIQSDLDKSVERFSKDPDSDSQAMAETLRGIQSAIEGAAKRQDPAFADQIKSLDRSYAELARMETAAGKDNELAGMFTPAQYGQAIRSADSRVRKRGVARGEALSQDLAQAALKVLPSKTPNSGTADRLQWGALGSGVGALGAAMAGAPAPLMGLGGAAVGIGAASRLYTPEAIQAANAALRQRMVQQSGLMERLGGELPAYRPVLPGLNAPNPFSLFSSRTIGPRP